MKNVLVPVCILVLGIAANLGATQETEPELKKLKALKTEPFSVVQIGDELKVVKKSELTTLKKELDKSYREAVKAYTQKREEARKAKEDFQGPKPVKESVKVLAASVKTAEEAEKLRDKLLNDYLVVQVQEAMKVVRKIEFDSFKAKLEADYRVALAKYSQAKKEAGKSRRSFKEPAPAKPKIKVLASRLTSEEAAQEKIASLQNKDRKPTKSRASSKKKKDKVEKEEKNEDEEIESVDDEADDEDDDSDKLD